MRVPLSWLRTLVPDLTADADDVAAALVRAGLEVEQVHRYGDDVTIRSVRRDDEVHFALAVGDDVRAAVLLRKL